MPERKHSVQIASGMKRPITEMLAALDECPSARRFAAIVGIWAALLAGVVNIRSISNDNVPNVLIPASLLRQGDVELGEFDAVVPARPGTVRYWAVSTPNGVFSRYPIWTGVAATPIFAPAVWLLGDRLDEAALLRIGRLAGLVGCGMYAGAMAAMLRRFVPGRWAAALTLLSILGTTLWHQIGSNLSTQSLPLACIALTLLILATHDSPSRSRALAAGLLAGLAAAARPPAMFAALAPLGAFMACRDARRVLPFAGMGAAVFPVLTLAYNASVFGSPLATGYGAETAWGFKAPFIEGALGLLFSPTCGLVVYSPFLCLGPWAAMRGPARPTGESFARRLSPWLLLGCAAQWLLFARWWAWNGALTFGGPRMLAETIPALLLLIAMHWRVIAASPAARRALVSGGAISLVLFLVGTTAFDAVAPADPPKPNWDVRVDIAWLYVRRFGAVSLLAKCALNGLLLTIVFGAGGWLASRFCRDDSPAQAPQAA